MTASAECLHSKRPDSKAGPWQCPDCRATLVVGLGGGILSVMPGEEEQQALLAARAADTPAPPPPLPKFKVGDVVMLRSGGLRMTVEDVALGEVDVAFSEAAHIGGMQKLLRAVLDENMLMLAPERTDP